MKYLIPLVLLLASCVNAPCKGGKCHDNQFDMHKIDTVEDCSVYRFFDAGHYHYTTICPHGEASTSTEQSSGKTHYPDDIPTQ